MFGHITASITGTITRVPTLLKNERGVFCYLPVVINYRRYNVPGTKDYVEPDPVYVDIAASGPMAESICKNAEKGMTFSGMCEYRDKLEKVVVDGEERIYHKPTWAVIPRSFDLIPVLKKTSQKAESSEPSAPAPQTDPEADFAPPADETGMVSQLPF